ncbi:unnamed protein product, partial [Symbiodinium sp. KB8]
VLERWHALLSETTTKLRAAKELPASGWLLPSQRLGPEVVPKLGGSASAELGLGNGAVGRAIHCLAAAVVE